MRKSTFRQRVIGLGAACLLAFSASAAAEEVWLGLGYDRVYNGHGFDLHKLGDTYILYFYTYDQDGNPEWMLGVAEMDGGVLAGDFLRFEYDEGSENPLVEDESFSGEFRLDFTRGTSSPACNDGNSREGAVQLSEFYWRIEEVSATWCTEFLRSGEAFNEAPYYGGVWYAGEGDSGYGFTMTHMGDRVTALVYYYDSEGQPRWALGVAEDDQTTVALDNYEGFCRTCPDRRVFTMPAGTLSLGWADGGLGGGVVDEAVLELSYPLAPFGEFNRVFELNRLSDGEPIGFYTRGPVLPLDAQLAVTWQEFRDDGNAEEVIVSTEFGNLDAERNANTTQAGTQSRPSVDMAADGSHVVTWEDDQDGDGAYEIHARVFNADGSVKVPIFTVNTNAGGQQLRPDVAMASGGDFVIAWEADLDGDDDFDIYMRGFNANGTQKFAQERVNTDTTGQQDDAAIAINDNGDFVVAWGQDPFANGFYDIAVKGFLANASVRFDQIRANSLFSAQQYQPDIAMAPGGGFVVIWNDDNDNNGFTQIHHRVYNANGVTLQTVKVTNQESIGSQVQPAVVMADDGTFAATWIDRDQRVSTRRFMGNGDPMTDEVAINANFDAFPADPSIGLTEDQSLLVVWSEFREDGVFRIKGNTLSPAGEVGAEFNVSAVPGGSQVRPVITVR